MPEKPKVVSMLFKPDGSVEVETTGFQGKACQAASAPYEEALGTRTAERVTAEGRVAPTEVKAPIKHKLG